MIAMAQTKFPSWKIQIHQLTPKTGFEAGPTAAGLAGARGHLRPDGGGVSTLTGGWADVLLIGAQVTSDDLKNVGVRNLGNSGIDL